MPSWNSSISHCQHIEVILLVNCIRIRCRKKSCPRAIKRPLQPAPVTQRLNMTPRVITGQQNPMSPQSVQGHAPGAVIDANPLRYAGPFSLTHISIHMSVAAPVITGNVSAQYLACRHHHFRAILQVQMWALTE